MTKSKGYRRSTRKTLRKHVRKRGISPLDVLLQNYNVGDYVAIQIDSGAHKGMPHSRYQGRTGKISEVRGRAYIVDIKAGKNIKKIVARPEHIKPRMVQGEKIA